MDGEAHSAADGATARSRWFLPLWLGLGATLLLLIGLGGLGDAPSPQGSAREMADHFVDRRTEIFWAAPFGYAGAVVLVVFALHLARRLHSGGQPAAGAAVVMGGVVVAAYHVAVQVIFTTLAYEVAAESPEVTKGLFVLTILAVPLLGLGGAVLLGGFAYGDRAARLVPRWLVVVTAVGAVLSSVSVASFAETRFFSPDVQQQVTGTLSMLWPAFVGGALAWRARDRARASAT